MANSFTLRHMPMQVVLLSGTIPPNAEAYLNGQFVLKEPIKIRSLSARLEIEYIRAKPRNDVRSMVAHFQQFLHSYKVTEGWSSEDRYIVFVSFMEDGKKVAEQLGLGFYHANSKKHPIRMEERRGSTVNGSKGNRKGLVATTALAAAMTIHMSGCCATLESFDMVTFVQQSGRVGRDGKAAVSLVIPKAQASGDADDGLGDLCGRTAMQKYTHPSVETRSYPEGCLRSVMGEFLDGRGDTCHDFGMDTRLCCICSEGE
ncbi:hypothetical protein APHAL10511_002789 [Amanita phalloides]|nr:hypothetical protein APHAL10511_002789 [Amanita phalloides]